MACLFSVSVSTAQTQNYVAKFASNGATTNSSIFDNGKVGIGTTNPGSTLTVNASSGSGILINNATDNSAMQGLNISSVSGKGLWFVASSCGGCWNGLTQQNDQGFFFTGGASGTGNLVIAPWNTSGGIRINSVGNVGIGTSLPSGALDVQGPVSGLIVAATNLDPGANYSLAPLQNSGKLLVGWNRTAGSGEIDLISNRAGGSAGGFSFYDYTNSGQLNPLVSMLGSGNVGIGVMTPGAKLEVNGNLRFTTGSAGAITFPDGTTQSTAWTGSLCGGDYAESVEVSGDRVQYEPGDVLVISTDDISDVVKSAEPYSTLVAGIYSTKPGLVGKRTADQEELRKQIPMAMVGIVPVKVTSENGAIKKGDLLVTSSTLGYAMKGTDHGRMIGAVVGKALASFESGKGIIDVLVSLQ